MLLAHKMNYLIVSLDLKAKYIPKKNVKCKKIIV